MPKKVDSFDFPHGGRKGLDFDFASLMDGEIWQLSEGEDYDKGKAESFLGSLSRYANAKGYRVNKHVSEDGSTVTVRARPKKVKEDKPEGETKKPRAKASATA